MMNDAKLNWTGGKNFPTAKGTQGRYDIQVAGKRSFMELSGVTVFRRGTVVQCKNWAQSIEDQVK